MKKTSLSSEQAAGVMAAIRDARRTGEFVNAAIGDVQVSEDFDGSISITAPGLAEGYAGYEEFRAACSGQGGA